MTRSERNKPSLTVFAHEPGTQTWHITTETFPTAAKTMCGKHVEADQFRAGADEEMLRAVLQFLNLRHRFCERCREAELRGRGQRR